MKSQVLEKIWIQFTVFSLGIAVLLAVFYFHPFKPVPEKTKDGSPEPTAATITELLLKVSDISGREATLYWHTGLPTNYIVRLGNSESELTEYIRGNGVLTNTHMVKIGNLEPKRSYYVQIVAVDQTGGEQVSKVYSFRTRSR